MNQRYKILSVMNNNVLLTEEVETTMEMVLIGKGLGFGRKKNQMIDTDDLHIEKSFKAGDSESIRESYLVMLKKTNGDIVEICTEILLLAEKRLGNLSDRSFIVVVDHISFAIEKIRKGIKIENPFVYEIQQLYPEEYAIGEIARAKIYDRFQVDITSDEVGFIAMHLYAAKEHVVVTDTLRNTKIIQQLTELIEDKVKIDFNKHPSEKNRLLSHMRAMLLRIDRGEILPSTDIMNVVRKECSRAYKIAHSIENHLVSENKALSTSDKFYLALHIERMLSMKDAHK